MLSSLSGAVGRLALKLVTLLQGKGEEDLEWTLEPWGLGFCEGTRDGQTEGFLDGFGERERVLPRFDDLERARATDFVCLTLAVSCEGSVSSHGLLRLS